MSSGHVTSSHVVRNWINIISSEKDMIIMAISNSVLDTDDLKSTQERNLKSEVHNYRVYFGGGKTSKIDIYCR